MCTRKEETPGASFSSNYAKVIEAFTSRLGLDFFVFENVPGLAQGRHRRRYLQFKRLCKKAGYSVREKVVNAGRFGIPQNRKRIIVIGINCERYPELEPRTLRTATSNLRLSELHLRAYRSRLSAAGT